MSSNKITLIGEDNFDVLEFEERKLNPFEQIEFTYNQSKKLYLSDILLGSQQQNLHPVIDIGSPTSWILTDEYSYDQWKSPCRWMHSNRTEGDDHGISG